MLRVFHQIKSVKSISQSAGTVAYGTSIDSVSIKERNLQVCINLARYWSQGAFLSQRYCIGKRRATRNPVLVHWISKQRAARSYCSRTGRRSDRSHEYCGCRAASGPRIYPSTSRTDSGRSSGTPSTLIDNSMHGTAQSRLSDLQTGSSFCWPPRSWTEFHLPRTMCTISACKRDIERCAFVSIGLWIRIFRDIWAQLSRMTADPTCQRNISNIRWVSKLSVTYLCNNWLPNDLWHLED